jgi:glycosyltransferase involved in cell wall biosynthesis
MKVSMFGTLPPLKGNAYYCWNLVEALSKKVEIEFFSFSKLYPEFLYPGGTKDSDEKFIAQDSENLQIRRILNIYNPFSWVKAGLQASGDLIHAQYWSLPPVPVWVTAFSILRRRGKKILLTVHTPIQHEPVFYEPPLVRAVMKRADNFIVHVEKNVELMEEEFGIPVEKTHHVPMGSHGIAGSAHNSNGSSEAAKKELGINEKSKTLLFFGNIREYKGIEDFILTVSILKERYDGEVTGIIAGQPWDKFDKYTELMKEKNVEDNFVTNLGYIPASDVGKYFSASDVVLLPYKIMDGQTGIGYVALEHHKPLVVTNVGGLPDLVLDKEFIAEPNRPDQLAEKVMKIFDNEDISKKLAEDAKVLLKAFSWDSISDKTVDVYQKMLSS